LSHVGSVLGSHGAFFRFLKRSSRIRCHHLLKTFYTGWTETQYPDGTVVWTTPNGRSHITTPTGARPSSGVSAGGAGEKGCHQQN
jgi:hypothetical protein